MPTIEHLVLVDLENVPVVDLGGVEGKPVHVMLLIGKQQKKLELGKGAVAIDALDRVTVKET